VFQIAFIDENGGGQGRLRIGDWRVIFIEDATSITVVAVGHRREIYD
jgi:mRNA-degrading endonuclease RelE of RelBE toxin-antitoxin system